jgi:predicted nucleic acid-binding Zn ribbon protein
LRLMRADLLRSLLEKFPEAGITELSIRAPGAPSWKHGRRSVPGRGPRDTYG